MYKSVVLKTKTPIKTSKIPKIPQTPKTPKLKNKDPQYFWGLRNYDQLVANATYWKLSAGDKNLEATVR